MDHPSPFSRYGAGAARIALTWLAVGACLAPRVAQATTDTPHAPRIEVAFVIDTTGSMGPYIREARERITAIARDLSAGTPTPEVRFALVEFRDRGDAYVTRVHRFTGELERMLRYLRNANADGGGDIPESVLAGLDAGVRRLDWSADDEDVVKLMYLVADAPDHGYADGPTEAQVTARARARGIVIHTIACGSLARRGSDAFERYARHTEGRAFRLTDRHRRHAGRGSSADGDAGRESFGGAVSGTARAYSGAAGVEFDEALRETLPVTPMAIPASAETGLMGSHIRWVRDPATLADLFRAHISTMPADARPSLPEVDFTVEHVLILGGRDAGFTLDGVERIGEERVARVTPIATAGVRFYRVALTPSAETDAAEETDASPPDHADEAEESASAVTAVTAVTAVSETDEVIR